MILWTLFWGHGVIRGSRLLRQILRPGVAGGISTTITRIPVVRVGGLR